jgi:hypothetical protein
MSLYQKRDFMFPVACSYANRFPQSRAEACDNQRGLVLDSDYFRAAEKTKQEFM